MSLNKIKSRIKFKVIKLIYYKFINKNQYIITLTIKVNKKLYSLHIKSYQIKNKKLISVLLKTILLKYVTINFANSRNLNIYSSYTLLHYKNTIF